MQETAVRDADALDLTPLERWAPRHIPADWLPVYDLCREIADQPEPVVDRLLARIEHEVGTYGDRESEVTRADLRASIARNLEMMLTGIAERRGPAPDELRIRRELGRRRAIQGFPVDALLQAFLVGYRELWDELVERARDHHPEAESLLLTAAAMVWQWVHEITEAVGSEYQNQRRRDEALATRNYGRFLDELRRGDLTSDRITDLARSVGFDPTGSFQAACAALPVGSPAVTRLPRDVNPGGPYIALEAGHMLTLLGQGIDVSAASRTLVAGLGCVPLGIGLPRPGLAGARLSLGDAERAAALSARRGSPCDFDEDWLAATLLASQERLEQILAPGREVASSHKNLVATIRTFSACGFSQSATARHLGVHTNTVGYRLARWEELTGWNPRSGEGLARSLLAVEL